MSESNRPFRYRTTLALLVGLILVAGCSSIPAATPALTPLPATATPPALSRDLAFCGFDPIRGVADVYVTSSAQAAPTNLTRGAKQIADSAERPDTAACWFSTYNRRNYEALGLDWAPNGDRLVYIAGAAGGPDGAQMRFVAIDGSGQAASLPVPAPVRLNQPRAPAWSPDGERIAYIAFDRTRASPNIYALGPEDFAIVKPRTQYARPRSSPFLTTPIAWSPDGERLAVSTGGGIVILQEGTLPITVTEETFADLTLPR